MSTTIATATATISDTIRDRVRAAVFDTLPPDTIDAYIKREWAEFTTGWEQYGQKQPSPLQRLIRAEFEASLKPIISARITEAIGNWHSEDNDALIAEIVRKMAPDIFTAMLEGVAVQAIRNLRNG